MNKLLMKPATAFRKPIVALACLLMLACDAATQSAPSSAASDGTSEGHKAYNNYCRTCHSLKQGDDRLGPSLAGIVGRKAGGSPGYSNYSGSVAGSGIVWDEDTLDRFIASPDSVIPGNNMKPYAGLNDPEVRKQIVQYLKSPDKAG
jgi:cytochrome c